MNLKVESFSLLSSELVYLGQTHRVKSKQPQEFEGNGSHKFLHLSSLQVRVFQLISSPLITVISYF